MMVDDPMVGGCDRSIPVTIVGYRAAGTAELGAKSLWTVPELWKTRRPRPGRVQQDPQRVSHKLVGRRRNDLLPCFSSQGRAPSTRPTRHPRCGEKKKKNGEYWTPLQWRLFTDGG